MWEKIKRWFGYVDERQEVKNYLPPRKRTGPPSPPPKGYSRPASYTGRTPERQDNDGYYVAPVYYDNPTSDSPTSQSCD